MSGARKWWFGLGGAAMVAAVVGAGVVMAQTPSSTPSASPRAGKTAESGKTRVPGANGTFSSNEDAAHEAGESAEQEASEDSGQRFHGGGKHGGFHRPNEDPTHEAGESPEREATENAGIANATHDSSSKAGALVITAILPFRFLLDAQSRLLAFTPVS